MNYTRVEDYSQSIASAILAFMPPPNFKSDPIKAENLDTWDLSREISGFILSNPNAFLIGSIFNFQIPFRKAWEAPLELKRRLGHLDISRLATMDVGALDAILMSGPHGTSMHRFTKNVAQRIISASNRLLLTYAGNAANIWLDGISATDVLMRLEEFDGIGQKIGNMMVRLLGTWFGVRITGWNNIDIAVDRHVERVFRRTGLVSTGRRSAKQQVIEMARSLRPDFPGMLDDPTFTIGAKWCTEQLPRCDSYIDGQECPLRKVCAKVDISMIPGIDRIEAATEINARAKVLVSNINAEDTKAVSNIKHSPRGAIFRVRWNPNTSYRYSRVGTATNAIYNFVEQNYPDWIDISTLVDVARKAGHTGNTDSYIRNKVIPYAVEARYKRYFMIREDCI